MDCFRLHFLGCGSALPTLRHHLTAQILQVREKCFLIDCGEGTQLQIRKMHLNFNKITDVFISHLHGDHCFGLIGLISTMGLLGRTSPLRIHAHPDLERQMVPQLDFFCRELSFEVQFFPFNPAEYALIYQDRSISVYTLPLIHRVPTCGFLFREQPRQPHIIKEMIDFYHIPLCQIPAIKEGADFQTEDGTVVENRFLTRPAKPSVSYAYCSDTAYNPNLIPLLKKVTVLYHEATYGDDMLERCGAVMHSTARQAASIAQAAEAGQLWIGHYSARYARESDLLKEAQSVFPNTKLADEGMVVEIQ